MIPNPSNNSFNLIPEDNFRQALLLIALAIIMFFLRTVPLYDLIFTDWPGDHGKFVNFAADDAVYHMRLVHNTIHHFPWRIFFDPFTHFPFGNQIHFGPLFTLIIAGTTMIIGLGNPSPELINIVGAYIPPVMGTLCILPVYFIARNLIGKQAAILSTFVLAFLPGAFLQRSGLGFADHHVAEVLFSTFSCCFLISALTKPNKIIKHGLLAGIFFGLFMLVWPAALMFGAIFLGFFIIQLIADHLHRRPTKYLLTLTTIIYTIPALMTLPYALMNPQFGLAYYSLTQPIVLLVMLLIFSICYLTHLTCKNNRFARDMYSLILVAVFSSIFFGLSIFAPKLFKVMVDGWKLLFTPAPGMRTITEVHPSILNQNGDAFSIIKLWGTYFWTMLFVVFGLGNLCYRVYKNTKPAELLLLVWSIAILFAAVFQCRFNYYLAINAAIIAGCYTIHPFFNFLSNLKFRKKIYNRLLKIYFYTMFICFIILVVDPILMLLIDKSIPRGIQVTKEQHNTYMWLKNNTPDPQGKKVHKNFDYAAGYYPIPKNIKQPYPYPDSAYGIMAWWDIGHQITYIAERIPNTNPFQMGVIEKNGDAGAAAFFISTNENSALKNLETVGSRYVLIDRKTASNIVGIGIWLGKTKGWTKQLNTQIKKLPEKTNITVPMDSDKFYHSMLNRLYYEDANGLEHFRLIHESNGDYAVLTRKMSLTPKIHTGFVSTSFGDYKKASDATKIFNRGVWSDKNKTVLAYQARPPTKNIKIFEKVKGATITGKAPKNTKDGTNVNLKLQLKTKFDRIFTYNQTTKIKNGKYKFVVPYSTTKMTRTDYSYDIEAKNPYTITIGSKIIKVSIPEKAIINGLSVYVNDF